MRGQLGQGTYSRIIQAYDSQLMKEVALKIERRGKNQSILMFEHNVLTQLRGLKHVCNVYDFVENTG